MFAPEQEELFRQVLTALNEKRVPYAVSGAFALKQHTGICRDTKDLDLFLAPEDVPAALRALHENGFETEVTDPVWLAKAHRGDYFVDLITGMSNGVVTVDRSWIERSTCAEIVGIPARVLAPEELIASKLFVTFRERFDGADIAHVIHGTRGRLDWDRVLQLAGEHWEMVLFALVLFRYAYPSNTNYVPRHIWRNLLNRFEQVVMGDNNTHAPFRGSLLDDKMFAIDVKEWGMRDFLSELRRQREPKIPDVAAEPAA